MKHHLIPHPLLSSEVAVLLILANGLELKVTPVKSQFQRVLRTTRQLRRALLLVKLTFTPDKNAASLFDPIAYIAIPNLTSIQAEPRLINTGKINQTKRWYEILDLFLQQNQRRD
jgi:hypothetical protein